MENSERGGPTLTLTARSRHGQSHRHRDQTPESDTHSAHLASGIRIQGRGRDNKEGRHGMSRRQAKRERARAQPSGQTAGRLGKHVLHY